MHLDQPVIVGAGAIDDDEDEIVVAVDFRSAAGGKPLAGSRVALIAAACLRPPRLPNSPGLAVARPLVVGVPLRTTFGSGRRWQEQALPQQRLLLRSPLTTQP
jgi:hypothetical protein